MGEGFWLTILGGFLAGAVGVLLFFIQRCVESTDKERNLLYRIYHLIQSITPVVKEHIERWQEVESLSLLLKDRELAKEIFLCANKKPVSDPCIQLILNKVCLKLNKKLFTKDKRSPESPD